MAVTEMKSFISVPQLCYGVNELESNVYVNSLGVLLAAGNVFH